MIDDHANFSLILSVARVEETGDVPLRSLRFFFQLHRFSFLHEEMVMRSIIMVNQVQLVPMTSLERVCCSLSVRL